MNIPWILGTLIAIGFFAVVETYAFDHPNRVNTLSKAIYDLGSNWPISIWLMGIFCGSLGTHFFWHWCPAGSISVGMLMP